MKMFRRVTIGMVLAGVAAPSLAASNDREDLALCKSDLKKIYGEDTRMKLKSLRKKSGGTQMRIQSFVDGESYIANCFVNRDGETNLQDSKGVALEAAQYDPAGKVTSTQ